MIISTVTNRSSTGRSFGRELRHGYTLIEMVIGMVLVAALMSAVWGTMSLYNRLLTSGKSQTSQQQLVRSLFQLMSEDLSTIVLETEPQVSSGPHLVDGDFLVGEAGIELEVPEEFANDAVAEFNSGFEISLVGNATALQLTSRRKPLEQHQDISEIDLLNELGDGNLEFDDSTSPNVPEFQSIVYQFQATGMGENISALPSGLYRFQVDSGELGKLLSQRSTIEESMASDEVGIDRMTLEALLFPTKEEQREEEEADQSVKPTFDMIPEVVGCKFEYFDGQNWLSLWSEERSTTLPCAIKISLDVVTADQLMILQSLTAHSAETSEIENELSNSFSRDTLKKPVGNSESLSDPLAMIIPQSFSKIILLDTTRFVTSEFATGQFEFSENTFSRDLR